MTFRSAARLCAVLSVAAGVLASADARAADARAGDDDWSQYDRRHEDWGMFGFEAFGTRWSRMPPLTLQGANAPRRFVGLSSPGQGPLTAYGAGLDWGLRINGFAVRLLQLRYATAVTGQSGLAQADDARIGIYAGPLHLVEVGAPFLGIVPFSGMGGQLIRKHWKTTMTINTGWAYAWATGTVTGPGPGVATGSLTSMSLYVRPELDACVHLGEVTKAEFSTWACVTAATNVYEFGWMRGSTVGVRFDL